MQGHIDGPAFLLFSTGKPVFDRNSSVFVFGMREKIHQKVKNTYGLTRVFRFRRKTSPGKLWKNLWRL
jgi:hypothetical protein